MKKAIIKFIIWLIIILAIAGTVFFFGWLQFSVPAGSYGVMLSKSGGYHNKVITPGKFSWRWERLVPTNSEIFVFDLAPQEIEYNTSGILPSGDKFSVITEEKHNFSWKWGINVSASLNPNSLIAVIKENNLKTQDELNKYIKNRVVEMTQLCANEFIRYYLTNPAAYEEDKFHYGTLQKKISKDLKKKLGEDIVINTVELSSDFYLPDLELYKMLHDAYIAYEKAKKDELILLNSDKGKQAAIQTFRKEYLKEWGEILKEYPELIEFLAIARHDSVDTLKALKALTGSSSEKEEKTKTETE